MPIPNNDKTAICLSSVIIIRLFLNVKKEKYGKQQNPRHAELNQKTKILIKRSSDIISKIPEPAIRILFKISSLIKHIVWLKSIRPMPEKRFIGHHIPG